MYKVKESEVTGEKVEGAPGATIKWLLHKDIGVPNFELRILEVSPGGNTPEHSHHWEHEVYVLAGSGRVVCEGGEAEMTPGLAIFIPPFEKHVFKNDSQELLKFICVIPRRMS